MIAKQKYQKNEDHKLCYRKFQTIDVVVTVRIKDPD